MRLTNRLNRLEGKLPRPKPRCHLCGYPETTRLMCVETKHADPLPVCPGCGSHVTDDGTPIAGNYKRFIRGPSGAVA